MSEIASASINNFGTSSPKADFVPPSEEPIFILTASQLQDLITQAVEQATEPIMQEIQDLREQRVQDRAEFDRFRTAHKIFAVQTTNDLDQLFDAVEKPTTTPVKPTQKTQDHISEIAHILGNKEKRLIEGHAPRVYVDKLRKEGLSFSQLANVMGLSVDRIRQLSRIAATDQRFNVTWHPRKKNTKIIKLRRWDTQ